MMGCETQSLGNGQGLEHLVLVVHGIGQAAFTFGEIVEVNNECNIKTSCNFSR